MSPFDAHVQAFQDDLTEGSSLDRINRIREDWQAYATGIEEMKLHHNTLGLAIITRVLGPATPKGKSYHLVSFRRLRWVDYRAW